MRVPLVIYPLDFFAALRTMRPHYSAPTKPQHSNKNAARITPNHAHQQALGIHEIKFNPVARTAALKALKLVAERERRDVPLAAIEEIVEVSGGDLRCAINSLQMMCLQVPCRCRCRANHTSPPSTTTIHHCRCY